MAAYHSCKFDKAREAINSAQAKYFQVSLLHYQIGILRWPLVFLCDLIQPVSKFQLQVPDEALSHVMDMGFKEREAKRALRMCHQDVCKAVDFLFEERTKREKKREEDIQRQKEIMHVFAKLASIFFQ